MRRVHLLPPGHSLGWTPYAWLLYLITVFIEPVIRAQHGRADAVYWAATFAAVALFLVVYFRAFWERGLRILPWAGVMVLLGIVLTPINTGAPVFFVYGAAAAANVDRQRDGFIAVALIALIGGFTTWFVGAPSFSFIMATLVTLLIGSVNVFFAAQHRAQRKLRLAQEEIEHLAAVAERERIARDLHDVLGHTLSLIVLKSELAHRLALKDAARAAAEMKDVENVARRTLQEVREAISGYRASLADERGRAEAMLRAAGIAAEFSIDDAPLPQAVEETLALALREAVTNVARHSGASRCHVLLERHPGETTLVIADDGRGMSGQEGGGMRGMRDRVTAFGGTVEVARSTSGSAALLGAGATVRVSMPATQPPPPAPAARKHAS